MESSSEDGGEGDESTFVDTQAKLTVSIMARSVKDNVYVYLEEIPCGEVAMELVAAAKQTLDGSVICSTITNPCINGNQPQLIHRLSRSRLRRRPNRPTL